MPAGRLGRGVTAVDVARLQRRVQRHPVGRVRLHIAVVALLGGVDGVRVAHDRDPAVPDGKQVLDPARAPARLSETTASASSRPGTRSM